MMKCKICGATNVVQEDSHYTCKSCGAVFYSKPEDDGTKSIAEIAEEKNHVDLEQVAEEIGKSKEAEEAAAPSAMDESFQIVMDTSAESKEAAPISEPESESEQEIVTEATPTDDAVPTPEEPQTGEETEEKAPKKKSVMKEILDFCLPIIIALIIAMVLKTFVFANAQVPTGSMLNTIQEGDRVIASRIEYKFHEPERFDIIIFKFPDDVAAHKEDPSVEVEYYVKRIIGLPGETVTIVNGTVYVTDKDGNSQQLKDDFITACTPTGNFGPYEVPEDSYFVLGDNRESSIDSRYWKTTNYVDKDLIIGKVKFRYYPSFGKLDTESQAATAAAE